MRLGRAFASALTGFRSTRTPGAPQIDMTPASAKDTAFNSLSLGKGMALGGGQSSMMSAIKNRRMNMYGGKY